MREHEQNHSGSTMKSEAAPPSQLESKSARDATGCEAAFLAAVEDFGHHSLIPPCCVAAYVRDEAAGLVVGADRDAEFGFPWPASPISVGYVPCPDCYARLLSAHDTPAAIHVCDDDDAECRRVQEAYNAAFYATWRPERVVVLASDRSWSITTDVAGARP